MLTPYVECERDPAWQVAQAAVPPVPVPPEHLRHRGDLDAARTSEQELHERAYQLSEQQRVLRDQLAGVPFWSRARRTQLAEQIGAGDRYLTAMVEEHYPAAASQVSHAAAVVHADEQSRDRQDAAAAEQRDRDRAERPDTEYVDPNTLTYPIGTSCHRTQPAPPLGPNQWMDPSTDLYPDYDRDSATRVPGL